MTENQQKYYKYIIDELLSDTETVDVDGSPYVKFKFVERKLFSVRYLVPFFKNGITMPSWLHDYLVDTYGLYEEETWTIWDEYRKIILDKIDEGNT
ncbi:MAG: hypothetical protein GTN59_04570 [Candidatus Dadabacteria bacterium]|nr:hypothetical protein [Candidatus Dadabacteria bacterium]